MASPSLRAILLLVTTALAAAAAAAPASAASIDVDRSCYNERAPMEVSGRGFTPGTSWTVTTTGLTGTGIVDSDGTFRSPGAPAPVVLRKTTRPTRFTLSASVGGRRIATRRIRVVNLLVTLGSTNGRPTGRTRWQFSGFDRGKSVYLHVRRGGRTIRTVRMGRADRSCGRLSVLARRLPGIRSSRIRPGTYRFAIDSRKKYSSRTRPQYRTGIRVLRR